MEQNNNYYQQNWNKPPQNPQQPKKNNRWIIWVVLGVVVAGLAGGLIYGVSQLGKSMGNAMNKVASSGIELQDSISNKKQMDDLFARLGNDSLSNRTRLKLSILNDEADSLYHLINSYNEGFRDTLVDVSGLAAMNQIWGRNYFIKTGRAFRLKKLMLQFREESIRNLPADAQDSSLHSLMIIDDIGKGMPDFMKNMMSFENINFNQAVFTIRMNFQKLKTQIGMFEQAILNSWNLEIDKNNIEVNDTVK